MKGYRESIREAAIEISNTVDTGRAESTSELFSHRLNDAKEYEPLSDFVVRYPPNMNRTMRFPP